GVVSQQLPDLQANENHGLALMAFYEGFLLGQYRFKLASERPALQTLKWPASLQAQAQQMEHLCDSVFWARDLVNLPYSHLDAEQLAERFQERGKSSGFEVEVWGESKIASQKMGGLLGVNQGSQSPPTFSILEYKSPEARNSKPYVLVGKGVVFDTGGLSLKPTPNSMDLMKCDMAGAASVAAVIDALALSQAPIHAIALVPATDNRPGEMALCPGDVIEMSNGSLVEVLNTDAEGRLILADALNYAGKLDPEFVVDVATLTGAAARALGPYGAALMGHAPESLMQGIKQAGERSFERLVELPLWPEFDEEIKSDIADLKNLGKGEGGAQSAGAFLKHFTSYPWMHLDIAGPAFLPSARHYIPKGGTGFSVRLLVNFLTSQLQHD
ncbi:MAG: leucyl aminopeptidase family protein, partial [Bacteroidia bacterium]